MKKKHIIIIVVVLVLAAAAFGISKMWSAMAANLEEVDNLVIQDVDLLEIDDGIYLGSYNSMPVSAEVKVLVENHKIVSIELINHDNGKGKDAEVIPGKVVEAQSLDVDIVTGATYSSKVILKAIEHALLK